MKNEGKDKKRLIIILVVLGLLIVGLIVGIVIAVVTNNKEIACADIEDGYERRVCMSQTDTDSNSREVYNDSLKRALENEDYDLFNGLIEDRALDLTLEGECNEAINWLNSIEQNMISELPATDLYGFYVNGVQVAIECENEGKEEYYRAKMDEVQNGNEEEFYTDYGDEDLEADDSEPENTGDAEDE